jgi:hypothetical protein
MWEGNPPVWTDEVCVCECCGVSYTNTKYRESWLICHDCTWQEGNDAE